MAGQNTEDLLIEIKADNKNLIAGLNQANAKIDDLAKRSVVAGEKSGGAFNSMTAAVMRFAGPAAIGFAIKQLYDLGKEALEFADNINDTSAQLNLTTDAFQELSYAAKLSGVEQDQFNVAIRTMNKVIGDAIDGNKDAAATIASLGLNLKDIANMSADKAFEAISQQLSQLPNDFERANKAQTIFGKGGAAIAAMAKDGASAIQQLREEAKKIGAVMDEALIKKAGEAHDKFDALSQVTKTQLMSALVDLTPVILGVASAFAKIASLTNEFTLGLKTAGKDDGTVDWVRRQITYIDKYGDSMYTAAKKADVLLNLQGELASRNKGPNNGRVYKPSDTPLIPIPKPVVDRLTDVIGAGTKADGPSALDKIYDEWNKSTETEAERLAAQWGDIVSDLNGLFESGQLGSGQSAIDEYNKRLKEINDKYLPDVAVTAKKVGNEASSNMRTSLQIMVDDWKNSGERIAETWGQAMDSVSDGLTNVVMGQKVEWEDLERTIVKALIKIQLQKALATALDSASTSGGFLGSFAKALSGKAGGGSVRAGQVYPVGERGPEMFVPATAGKIVPNYALSGGGGGSVRVQVVNNGTPQQAQSATATQTPEGIVVNVLLNDLKNGGKFSTALGQVYGMRRRPR